MSVTDDSFFTENIVNINKKINAILFHASMVPIIFVILTYAGVWYVPTNYAIMVFVYTQVLASVCRFLNRSDKKARKSLTKQNKYANNYMIGRRRANELSVAVLDTPFFVSVPGERSPDLHDKAGLSYQALLFVLLCCGPDDNGVTYKRVMWPCRRACLRGFLYGRLR